MPTAGKSYLSTKIADTVGGLAVHLDDLRESLSGDGRYKNWINFYLDQDEEKYLVEVLPEKQWQNLVDQSEAIWPMFKNKIESYITEPRPVIFECVNLLPHLASREFNFPGIVLLGNSYEETLKRNQQNPRWGNSEKLQKLEAKCFWEVERPRYLAEGQKYNWSVFENTDDAFNWAIKLFQ